MRLEDLLRPPYTARTTTPTRTNFHTLLLVDNGISAHHVDFESYPVEAGDLLIVPSGSVQAFDRARVISGYLGLFTNDFLECNKLGARRLAEAIDMTFRAGVHLRLGETSRQHVRASFEVLARHTQAPCTQRFSDDLVASAFAILLFTVAGLPETAASLVAQEIRDPLVTRFLELLEARFTVSHEANSYARALRVSLRTLDRHLMATRGQSTRQHIAARLVLESKRLLTRPDMSVKHVAYELGFSEPANFSRFFRCQTGLSPQAFRDPLVEFHAREA